MSNGVSKFIVDELSKKAPMPTDVNIEDYDYLSAGHIDSMGLINFIMSIEAHFNIELSTEDLQSDSFRTVKGLAELIDCKLNDV